MQDTVWFKEYSRQITLTKRSMIKMPDNWNANEWHYTGFSSSFLAKVISKKSRKKNYILVFSVTKHRAGIQISLWPGRKMGIFGVDFEEYYQTPTTKEKQTAFNCHGLKVFILLWFFVSLKGVSLASPKTLLPFRDVDGKVVRNKNWW